MKKISIFFLVLSFYYLVDVINLSRYDYNEKGVYLDIKTGKEYHKKKILVQALILVGLVSTSIYFFKSKKK